MLSFYLNAATPRSTNRVGIYIKVVGIFSTSDVKSSCPESHKAAASLEVHLLEFTPLVSNILDFTTGNFADVLLIFW